MSRVEFLRDMSRVELSSSKFYAVIDPDNEIVFTDSDRERCLDCIFYKMDKKMEEYWLYYGFSGEVTLHQNMTFDQIYKMYTKIKADQLNFSFNQKLKI